MILQDFQIKYFSRNPGMAASLDYVNVKKTMLRAKTVCTTVVKKMYPSVKEFGEHLEQHPKSLEFEFGEGDERRTLKIEAKLLRSSAKYYHIAMYDPDLVKEFSSNDHFGDGTFSIRPDVEGCVQVFVVLAKKYCVVSIMRNIFFQSVLTRFLL